MENGSLIGVLAISTLGAAFLIAAFLLLRHNFDPKNRAATKTVAEGGPSAHTAVRGGEEKPRHMD